MTPFFSGPRSSYYNYLLLCIVKFTAYHLHYKEKLEMIESVYNLSPLWLPLKLSLLVDASSDYIFKLMKPSYSVQKVGKHWFATYYPHYQNKLVGNPSQTFGCTINCLYFLGNLNNFSVAFPLLADNNKAYDPLPSLVAKKAELLKTLIYLLSHFLQLLSLMISLTLSKMHLPIFEYLAIFKCVLMFEWQISFKYTPIFK